jgi:hypothetical protein
MAPLRAGRGLLNRVLVLREQDDSSLQSSRCRMYLRHVAARKFIADWRLLGKNCV